MRKHLGEILANASHALLTQGAAVLAQLDVSALLARVGLEKKRSSLVGPGLGVVAGVVAGSALTLWLGPALLPLIKQTLAPPVDGPKAGPKVAHDDTGRSNTLDYGST